MLVMLDDELGMLRRGTHIQKQPIRAQGIVYGGQGAHDALGRDSAERPGEHRHIERRHRRLRCDYIGDLETNLRPQFIRDRGSRCRDGRCGGVNAEDGMGRRGEAPGHAPVPTPNIEDISAGKVHQFADDRRFRLFGIQRHAHDTHAHYLALTSFHPISGIPIIAPKSPLATRFWKHCRRRLLSARQLRPLHTTIFPSHHKLLTHSVRMWLILPSYAPLTLVFAPT